MPFLCSICSFWARDERAVKQFFLCVHFYDTHMELCLYWKRQVKIYVLHTERTALKFQCSTILGSSHKVFGQKVIGCFLGFAHLHTAIQSLFVFVNWSRLCCTLPLSTTWVMMVATVRWAVAMCWVCSNKKTSEEKLKIGGKSAGVEQFSDVLRNSLLRMAHLCGCWNIQRTHERTRKDKENEVMAFGLPQHCFYTEEKSWG